MAILEEALDKIEEQRQYIRKLQGVLQLIHQDAEMALADVWDRSDDGFQCQIDSIVEVFPEVKPWEPEECD